MALRKVQGTSLNDVSVLVPEQLLSSDSKIGLLQISTDIEELFLQVLYEVEDRRLSSFLFAEKMAHRYRFRRKTGGSFRKRHPRALTLRFNH